MSAAGQDIQPGRYQVVPRTLIFLRREDEVLLIRGAAHKSWAGRYNGVGGHIERGEEALSAARRELREETGLEADLWLAGTLINDTGGPVGVAVFLFAGEQPAGDLTASPEGTPEWVALAGIASLPLRFDDLGSLLPRVMSCRRGDAPFSARSYYEHERLTVVFADQP